MKTYKYKAKNLQKYLMRTSTTDREESVSAAGNDDNITFPKWFSRGFSWIYYRVNFLEVPCSVADPGFSKWGGAVLSQMGGSTSCFQVKSA